jgi:hypothetical protein
MNIPKNDARTLMNDYYANATGVHFKPAGKSINGFIFTRTELYRLFEGSGTKHVFLMLALQPYLVDPTYKHITLIAGSVSGGVSAGTLDLTKFEIGQPLFYPTLSGGKIKPHWEAGPGEDMPSPTVISRHGDFLENGATAHLYPITNSKIRGYHLENNDLTSLGLMTALTAENCLDRFIFMPIIRTKNYDGTSVSLPYLSMVASRYNGALNGNAREYCLPCPTSCPSNFPIQ